MWQQRGRILGGAGIVFCFLAALWSGTTYAGPLATPPVQPHARAFVVVDSITGQVIAASNADRSVPMASTTKIMTTWLLLEHMELDDVIWVPFEARGIAGSKLYLEPGERYTVAEMAYALMISSANDAATTVAVNVGGTVEGFVDLMNRRAAELGMTNTRFANPHGLHHSDHFASARDLAVLAREAMADPVFRGFAGVLQAEISHPIRDTTRVLSSHNTFLARTPRATGIKTGFTNAARFSLVGSARQGEREVIGVILGGDSAAQVAGEMEALLDWALDAFELVELVGDADRWALGPEIDGIQRWALPAAAVSMVRQRSDDTALPLVEIDVDIPGGSAADMAGAHAGGGDPLEVLPGEEVGTLAVRVEGRHYASVPLVLAEEVLEGPDSTISEGAHDPLVEGWPVPVPAAATGLAVTLVTGLYVIRRRSSVQRRRYRFRGVHRL
ncbi:MAG: D-alanyl-D-alanine carboxypeptidase family protein [Thermaerobacterales bacterium]